MSTSFRLFCANLASKTADDIRPYAGGVTENEDFERFCMDVTATQAVPYETVLKFV